MKRQTNSRLSYLYRDAANYKQFADITLPGRLHLSDIEPYLYDRLFFIPSAVGLTDLQPSPLNEYDHPWHELQSIEPTADQQTCDTSASELIERFRSAARNNWKHNAIAITKGLP